VEGGVEKQTLSRLCLACNRGYGEHVGFCPNDGTPLIRFQTSEDRWIGKVLDDRYEVKQQLGKGGIGVVYLAQDLRTNVSVAIKMLQSELVIDEASIKRFEQEVSAMASMNHPHLVAWHGSGMTPTGQPFLVMEYLQGRGLREVIKEGGPIAPERAVHIFSQVTEGVECAHLQGLIHRDLKPSNIVLIEQNGDPDYVKVLDFGLVKLMPWAGKPTQQLTKAGESFGSPMYMCPEQCVGKKLSQSSDIYSLAITLFEALTGSPPFRGSNPIQTTSMHVHQSPPKFADVRSGLELPVALEAVVMTALQKDPADRFQSMSDFRNALQSALSGAPPPAAANSNQNLQPAAALNRNTPDKGNGGLLKAISGWLRRQS
jgi:eukaryotic-like serine/threonine-protein kinase